MRQLVGRNAKIIPGVPVSIVLSVVVSLPQYVNKSNYKNTPRYVDCAGTEYLIEQVVQQLDILEAGKSNSLC
jgi:hypothetical protein